MSVAKTNINANNVQITFEDQQKINKFARLNAKLEDLKVEMKEKENDLRKFEDACDELILLDEDEKIPYLVGEVFIYQSSEKTLNNLEEEKEKTGKEIADLKLKSDETKDLMSDLKSYLYGKFGNNINLEPDD